MNDTTPLIHSKAFSLNWEQLKGHLQIAIPMLALFAYQQKWIDGETFTLITGAIAKWAHSSNAPDVPPTITIPTAFTPPKP